MTSVSNVPAVTFATALGWPAMMPILAGVARPSLATFDIAASVSMSAAFRWVAVRRPVDAAFSRAASISTMPLRRTATISTMPLGVSVATTVSEATATL